MYSDFLALVKSRYMNSHAEGSNLRVLPFFVPLGELETGWDVLKGGREMSFLVKFAQVVSKGLPLWTMLVAGLAYLYPAYFKGYGPYLTGMLGFVMLSMGLTMALSDFKLVFTRPKGIFLAVVGRYIMMPLIAFVLVKAFDIPTSIAMGIILIACCPSGTSSNVMTFIAKGDAPLSVAATTINTLAAPILTPIIFLWLADSTIPVNGMALVLDIIKIVVAPVLLGIVIRSLVPNFVDKAMPVLPAAGAIIVVAIVGYIVAATGARLASVAVLVFAVVFVQNLLGYVAGYLSSTVARLPELQRRAVTFEIGIENAALAMSLALVHLDPMAAVPGAVFGLVEVVTGSLLAGYWARKPVTEEDTFRGLVKEVEVSEA